MGRKERPLENARMVSEYVKMTTRERIRCYLSNLWDAITTPPPEEKTVWDIIGPEDPRWDDVFNMHLYEMWLDSGFRVEVEKKDEQ